MRDDSREDAVGDVFRQAIEYQGNDRMRFVQEACAGDQRVRDEVLDLLAHADSSNELLDAMMDLGDPSPTSSSPKDAAKHRDELVGATVGSFRILRLLATGGMGRVYLAQQQHPRRRVALKVMKRGITSASIRRRFEYETQTLARLRHPCICQIHEAGVCDDDSVGDGGEGLPFFAMEYIPSALPITEYAETKQLDAKARLRLFAKVCDAVHHGHQKGIIHRDLKPSNILVDSAGEPKVIDFGVARATDSDLAVTTLQTGVGELIGTLQYMSPEQFDADPHDLDTRSDVYALGVVLYELLTRQLPYELTSRIHEAARVIREVEPKRPRTISHNLRGDIETITLMALEKDRARRYESAAALMNDINRYLTDETILARPQSALYQLRKFAKRNRGLAAGTSIALIVLVVSTTVSVRFGLGEARAMASLRRFITKGLAEMSEPIPFDQLHSQLDERDLSLIQEDLALREAIYAGHGSKFFARYNADAALPYLEAVLSPYDRGHVIPTREAVWVANMYGDALMMSGDVEHAYEHAQQWNSIASKHNVGNNADDTRTLRWELSLNLAMACRRSGRLAQARTELESLLVDFDAHDLSETHQMRLAVLDELARTLAATGEIDQSTKMHETVIARRRGGDPDNPELYSSLRAYGRTLTEIQRFNDAIEALVEAVQGHLRLIELEQSPSQSSIRELVRTLQLRGDLVDDDPLVRKAHGGSTTPEADKFDRLDVERLGESLGKKLVMDVQHEP